MRKSEHQGNDFKASCSETEVSEQVYYTARLQRTVVQSFVDLLAVRPSVAVRKSIGVHYTFPIDCTSS